MKVGISIRIDVTKIDKTRLYKGEKGTYLELTTFVVLDNKDQYENNGFVTASLSKEEREQKVQLPILGNVKVFYKDGEPNNQQQPAPAGGDPYDSDIPFAPFEKGTI